MDMKQTLLFTFLFILLARPVWTHQCIREDKVVEFAEKKLRSHFPHASEIKTSVKEDSPYSCPLNLYQNPSKDIKDRSLSPWRYIVKEAGPDQFPPTYTVAQCLCSGCVIFDERTEQMVESSEYISIPIVQSRVFLRREPCADGQGYHLKPFNLDVAVGCTCARPNVRLSP